MGRPAGPGICCVPTVNSRTNLTSMVWLGTGDSLWWGIHPRPYIQLLLMYTVITEEMLAYSLHPKAE